MANTSTSGGADHAPLTASPDLTHTAETAVVDIATKAKDTAKSLGHAAAETVDQNRGSAARVLANTASTIRDGATRLPGGEAITGLARAAAEEIDTTAQYVREHDTQEMLADLKKFVTRHPAASVVGAAVVGVLVGRGFRKR